MGQASLSPLNHDNCVLSDARITGAIVAPRGSVFWKLSQPGAAMRSPCILRCLQVPPPLCCPHLIYNLVLLTVSCEELLWAKLYVFMEHRICKQFIDMCHRVTAPNVQLLFLTIIIQLVTMNSKCVTCPLRSRW